MATRRAGPKPSAKWSTPPHASLGGFDPKYGSFSNDPSLTDEEKQLLEKWVENGVPEGDPRALSQAPPFPEGWRISKPDLVLSMPKPFTIPAKGDLRYRVFHRRSGLPRRPVGPGIGSSSRQPVRRSPRGRDRSATG